MLLYHTTPKYNQPSIEMLGICTRYSQGRMKAVWLHAEEKTGWAFLHAVRRHGGRVEDVVTFAVEVEEDSVKRTSVPGLFYVNSDVKPESITGVLGFALVSESPIRSYADGK